MGEEETTAADQRSRLEIALRTPVDVLTNEQKVLLNASRDALSEMEIATLTEAGVLNPKSE